MSHFRQTKTSLLPFAKKVIETHGKVSDAYLDLLRQAGYKDSQILEIVTMRFSMTNFLNSWTAH